MQKLTITATALTDKGKEAKTLVTVVASTKSANALKEALAQDDVFVKDTKVENVFIDKAIAEKHVAAMVEEAIPDKAIRDAVIKHAMKALDGACVFERPPVKRG